MFVCVGDTLIKCLLNVILIKGILHSYGTCIKIFSFNSHNSKILGKKIPSFSHFTDGKLSLRKAKYQIQGQ